MPHAISNFDIAALSAINDLAARYSINPADFIATIRPVDNALRLQFEIPPADKMKIAAMDRLLDSLGVADGESDLVGNEYQIWVAMQRAHALAPRLTLRSR